MIKRNIEIPLNKDREYLNAENAAYAKLVEFGYFPQGITKDFKKVVVYRIENLYSNDEKKEAFYYDNWQEAMKTLCSC